MGSSYNPKIITDSLVLCLDAANPKSYPRTGNTWYDISGSNINATLINSPNFVTVNNTFGFQLDGINDYIRIPSNNYWRASTDSTMEIWYINSIANCSGSYVTYMKGGWVGWRVDFGCAFSVEYNSIEGGANMYSVYPSSPRNLFTCINFIIDRTNGYFRIYRNSILLNQTQILQSPISSVDHLYIGARGSVPDSFAKGTITNFKWYNRALSATEIQQNFNALRGRYGI